MPSPECCLTIVFPRAIRVQVVDFLRSHPSLASGFVVAPTSGHGPRAVYATTAEQVRGEASGVQMQAVVPEADARALLADLEDRFERSRIIYWITPLIASGGFL